MNFRKNKPADQAEPFIVPSLAECDAEYAALIKRRDELHVDRRRAIEEKVRLTAEVGALPPATRSVPQDVAALLGDIVDSTPATKRAELAAARRKIEAIDAALEELRKRLAEAAVKASAVAREVVRAEHAGRVEAICHALVALDAAHRSYAELPDAYEAEGIIWSPLGDLMPSFLGGAREPSRRIAQYLRDAAAAGYWTEAGR